jgi:hypothetical protein
MLSIPHCLDSRLTDGSKVVSPTHQPHFTPQKRYSFYVSGTHYLPSRHTVKQVQLAAFYSTLGRRFIAGGDYNAKHTDWGSRLITPRGREILRTMEQLNLPHLSTGEPTYWPSDRNKLPDLLDFCITKGIPTTPP